MPKGRYYGMDAPLSTGPHPDPLSDVHAACGEPFRSDGWQPIETAPRDRRVLLWGRYWSDGQGWFSDALSGWWSAELERWEANGGLHSYSFGVRPTHWMPLPAPPQTKE